MQGIGALLIFIRILLLKFVRAATATDLRQM
jgi:hypothetical protein